MKRGGKRPFILNTVSAIHLRIVKYQPLNLEDWQPSATEARRLCWQAHQLVGLALAFAQVHAQLFEFAVEVGSLQAGLFCHPRHGAVFF